MNEKEFDIDAARVGRAWILVSDELLINVCMREERAALLENGVLQELFVERAGFRGLIGNIYMGSVARVLPGLQAAFVNVGLERSAFLHASDIVRGQGGESGDPASGMDIGTLVEPGEEVLVQVLKEPLGSKGARLTTYITLPSRLLVFAPSGSGVSVSARIGDDAERERLRSLVESVTDPDERGGFIVRTAANGASLEALRADRLFLRQLWESIEGSAADARAEEIVYQDLPLATRMLRDRRDASLSRVRVDSVSTYTRMKEFAGRFMPAMSGIIEHYEGSRPIFDHHGIEDEVQRALDRRVPLQSGGYLIIDQTEALTTIDVNTGRYVGRRDLEDTSLRTNLEAAAAVARQLRLRNLGGIIIVDFIDMEQEEHRRQVVEALSEHLSADRGDTQVMNVSPLGLVEMSRKRTRDSLERILCRPCPTCEGRGFVRTPETVCNEIFREILGQRAREEFREVLVLAGPDVINRLLDEDAAAVTELERLTGASIRLQSEQLHAPEQFDVVPI